MRFPFSQAQACGNPATKRSIAPEDAANLVDSKPAAKKPRNEHRSLIAADPSIKLPLDALGLVMEFVSPRQLYNLAFSCKTLRGFITTSLVVKSALIQGGPSKTTMTELYNTLSMKCIPVPAPLRLLRLANGKRCEFCNRVRVNHIRPNVGVFSCSECAPFAVWVIVGDDNRAFQDASYTASSNVKYRLLCTSDKDQTCQEFNEAYNQTLKRSDEVAKERCQKKAASREKAKQNKLANIDKMTEKLKQLLDEPFRNLVLKKRELQYTSGRRGIVRYDIVFVDKILEPFVKAPTKMRKKQLTENAQIINEKLSLLITTNFVSLEFLSHEDPFEAALKTHFAAKFNDLKSFLEMGTHILQMGVDSTPAVVNRLDDYFFSLLEKSQLICALAYLNFNDLSFLFSVTPLTDVSDGDCGTLARTIWSDALMGSDAKGDDGRDALFRGAYETTATQLPKAILGLQNFSRWIHDRYAFHSDNCHEKMIPTGLSEACYSISNVRLLLARDFLNLHENLPSLEKDSD